MEASAVPYQVSFVTSSNTYGYSQQHGVHRLSEGQRLWVLAVQSLQGGHEGLPQLLGLEDWRRGGEVGQGRRDRLEVRQAGG